VELTETQRRHEIGIDLLEEYWKKDGQALWPIEKGKEWELAIRLLHQLHPPHDIGWHSVCVTCAQIKALEKTVVGS
jgi:hypothetical protein